VVVKKRACVSRRVFIGEKCQRGIRDIGQAAHLHADHFSGGDGH